MFKVCIIDDDSQSLVDAINSKINCELEIKGLKDVNIYNEGEIKNRIINSSDYDLVIFDGSLVEGDLDSITVMEQVIRWNPAAREKIMILIGKDIVEYTKPEDWEMYSKIQRSRQLPNAIHGGEGKTKIEIIIKLIKSYAKRKDIEIEDRLPQGTVSSQMAELLGKLAKNYESIIEMLDESYNICEQVEDLEANGDEEKDVQNRIERRKSDIIDMRHKVNNAIGVMNLITFINGCDTEKDNSDEGRGDF